MSSRLAKSTSKFRPVKPQQKKAGTPSASGSATPVPPPSSGQPAPPQLAPTPSSSQVNLDAEIGAEVASVGTSTTQASREQSLFPSSRAPSASNVTSERSSTPIVPTAGPPEPPASSQPRPSIAPSIPRPSPVLSTQPPSTDTANEPTAVRNARLSVPSASTSRQGTPISLGNAGNSFSVGSWESLEATQVSSSSTQPFPSDSQQTLVPDASQSSGPAGGSLLKEIAARVANAENTSLPQEASRVTQEEPSLPAPDTSSLATASSGPSASIIPSSPALQTSSGLALPSLPPEHTEDDTHEDIDAEGEVDLPGPTDDTPTAAEADEEATEATEAAPPAKKRGRPAGKANGTKTKKAPAKPKAKRGKVATQGGGAELEGEEEATSVASAINANEAGGQAEADNAAEDSAVISKKRKRKAPAKPKASTARARAAKRVRINNTADGAEEVDGAGEEDSALEDEHYEPWYIHKVHPGYSLNTTDIFAAVGVDLPEKFDFTTAQDAAEVLEGEEVGGEEGDETLRGDEEEQAAEGEEGEYDPDAEQAQEDDQEEEEEGTTPWYPLRAPIDPTTTTMKQLAENNEGGRMASRGRTNLGDKIDRKQRLRIAREKMKLRRVLLQKGFSAEAVDRLLDEKMEEILNGGILEFTLDDLERVTVPTAMPDAEQVSRQGTLRGDTGAQPLFRPEENSDDERESRQSDEENQGENAHRNEYDDEEEGFGGIAESRYAPQMRFVNGEFVLDESSTQIVRDNTEREAYAVVEDNPDGRKVNSYSWSKRGKASRWTLADTDLFYEGLTQFGTDFELISRMFSNRTRRQIKAKFVREERLDVNRIEEALSGKKKIDINFYERITKLDFRNGVVPADPMAKFYEDLPTLSNAVKLESNREPEQEDEVDLVALLRKQKEDTAGLPNAWENSRPADYRTSDQDAIPEEEEGIEGGDGLENQDEEPEPELADGEEREASYHSPSPEPAEEEPFSFSGGVQLRVSG